MRSSPPPPRRYCEGRYDRVAASALRCVFLGCSSCSSRAIVGTKGRWYSWQLVLRGRCHPRTLTSLSLISGRAWLAVRFAIRGTMSSRTPRRPSRFAFRSAAWSLRTRAPELRLSNLIGADRSANAAQVAWCSCSASDTLHARLLAPCWQRARVRVASTARGQKSKPSSTARTRDTTSGHIAPTRPLIVCGSALVTRRPGALAR